MGKILVMDDDARVLTALEDLLSSHGHEVVTAERPEEGLARLQGDDPDVVILDVYMPGMDGFETFRHIQELPRRVPVIVMSGRGTTELTIEAAKLGAFDYQTKPIEPAEMLRVVGKAISCVTLMRQSSPRKRGPAESEVPTIIGQSPPMQEVYKSIGRVAPTEATVLIRGESGTGKELVAEAIHRHSRRSAQPLVVVNCVAIPETLLESELFGYERGAFTGAEARRIGKFEQANGATIFLDEIGDVPLGIQAKILRILQEKTFERIGGNQTLRVDARILAATNRNLERAITEGKFREDLYHRLKVATVHIPPLRERSDDTMLLAQHFLARFAVGLEIAHPMLTADALDVLRAYSWPGNVRELQHCVHRAMIFTHGYPIRGEDVQSALQPGEGAPESQASMDSRLLELVQEHLRFRSGPRAYEELLQGVERTLLEEAMRQTRGKQASAARLLGLPRPTLHAKLHKHGLQRG